MTKREKQQRDEIKRTLIDMYSGLGRGSVPSTDPENPEYYIAFALGVEDWCRWIRSAVTRLCPVPEGSKIDTDQLIEIWLVPEWDTIKGAVDQVMRIRSVVADRVAREAKSAPTPGSER